jgi:hypothetical protein
MTTDVAIRDTNLDISHLSPLICMELAAGLSDADGVREKYNISEDQWLRLNKNPSFIGMLKEAQTAFAGDLNAGKRIVKKAEILLEEALPVLHNHMMSPEATASTVVDIVKQLKEVAGIGKTTKDAIGGGGGFNVNIEIHTTEEGKGVVIQGN